MTKVKNAKEVYYAIATDKFAHEYYPFSKDKVLKDIEVPTPFASKEEAIKVGNFFKAIAKNKNGAVVLFKNGAYYGVAYIIK